jgi:hypothetical protein
VKTRARTFLGVTAASATLVAALASPALAGAPKHGKYECIDLSYWVNLKTDTKYSVQTGGGGKWTYKPASKKIVFKNGPMDFAFGKYGKDDTGNPKFGLYDVKDHTYYGDCAHF